MLAVLVLLRAQFTNMVAPQIMCLAIIKHVEEGSQHKWNTVVPRYLWGSVPGPQRIPKSAGAL